jgi:transposase-like protein
MGTFHIIPKETKDQVLSRVKNDGVSAAQAARDAGISADTVRNWLAKTANGQNNEAWENDRLKRELSGAYELIGKLTAELSVFKKKTGNWR